MLFSSHLVKSHSFKTSVNFAHWPKQLIFNSSVSVMFTLSHAQDTFTFIQSVNNFPQFFVFHIHHNLFSVLLNW